MEFKSIVCDVPSCVKTKRVPEDQREVQREFEGWVYVGHINRILGGKEAEMMKKNFCSLECLAVGLNTPSLWQKRT